MKSLLLLAPLVCACHSSSESTATSTATSTSTSTATPTATSTATAAPSASAVASAIPPPQLVLVENIGMHIGGGPNDAVTKAPIAQSVAPHFDALRACWSQVDDATRAGDFGVDLLIPAEGGAATVSHPRTNLRPDAFKDCVVGVFTGIDFAKPRGGRTTVSYSLRFTPQPPAAALP
jgi:non-ribosomal peptide synthetase component F